MKKKSVFFKDDLWLREFLHYVIVFGVLLMSWVPVMAYFEPITPDSVAWTSIVVFVVFIVTDQIAHRVLMID